MSAVMVASPVAGERLVVSGGTVVGAVRDVPPPPRGRVTFTAWVEAGGVYRPVALPLRPYPSRRAAVAAVLEAAERRRATRVRKVAC